MVYRYVPIVRWKRGERAALKQTSLPNIRDVLPLILLNEDGFKDKPEKVTQEAVSATDIFVDDIYKSWGSRPFYLDASRLTPGSKGTHPLLEIAKRCREVGPHLIPATI